MTRHEHKSAARRQGGERPVAARGSLPRILTGFAALRWIARRPANDNRPRPAAIVAGAAVLALAAGALAYLALGRML